MWWQAFLFWLSCAAAAVAAPFRVAILNTDLGRDGPGLLLRDIGRGAADVRAVQAMLVAARADVVLLLRVDWDISLATARALNAGLGARSYAHVVALRPNTGMATGLDLDHDGLAGGPGDAQGFGDFSGQNGMVILSRRPVDQASVRDFSTLLWRDFPGADLPRRGDAPFWSDAVLARLRLSSVGHWDVPIELGQGRRLHLLAFHASPPVFDGPEDRNGRRNADEVRLWPVYLDGGFGAPPGGPVTVLGTANLDPAQGAGHRGAIAALLADPRLQDPHPADAEGDATVDWQQAADPPRQRVDYVLPGAGLRVLESGLVRPPAGAAPRHALVWVDLDLATGPP